MYKLDNFKSCCDYLGIDNTLPVCQIDERQIQAAYKLRVCMKAWNKQDEFEPDETANYYQEGVGYTPQFYTANRKLLLSSDSVNSGASVGIVYAKGFYSDEYIDVPPDANLGLRLPLSSRERAVDFGKTFIEIFNELI